VLARGRLVTTDNQIDVATGTIRLKADFPNKEGKLFPNQFVNVRMVVDVRRGAVVVPTAAIQGGNQGPVVYVVREDSTVALRPVKPGPAEGTDSAIESGVTAGERVIVDGVDRIREGVKVEVTQQRGPGGAPAAGAGGEGKGERRRARQEGTAPEASTGPSPQPTPKGEGASMAPTPKGEGASMAPPPKGEGARAAPATKAPSPQPAPKAEGAGGGGDREAFRKSLEGLSPEERREAIRKRLESMTPEQREEWKKRRAEREGAAN
jgi:hypothetical protein